VHGEHRLDGADRVVEAELVDLAQREIRALARANHVEEQWQSERLQSPRDLGELLYAARGVDVEPVDADRGIRLEPRDRVVEIGDAHGVGARDDEEVGIPARGQHRAQLLPHLLGRDQLLAREMPALFRHRLVFDVQHGRAGFFPELDRALRLEHAAVARVRVREYRHARDATDPADVVEHLRLCQHAEVGRTRDDRGRDEAAHVDRGRAGSFRELRRDRVVRAEADERRALQQLAEARRSAHGFVVPSLGTVAAGTPPAGGKSITIERFANFHAPFTLRSESS
jgi:hypothetical protein